MARERVNARVPMPNFIGQIPVFGWEPEPVNEGDFRQVPASDRGNDSYADRGQLGTWSEREPFETPREVRFEVGYGAVEDDIRRGYCEPTIREEPAYDLANYKSRSTLPRSPDEDDNPATTGMRDIEFRGRGERSRGFLTRPKIPTDR